MKRCVKNKNLSAINQISLARRRRFCSWMILCKLLIIATYMFYIVGLVEAFSKKVQFLYFIIQCRHHHQRGPIPIRCFV